MKEMLVFCLMILVFASPVFAEEARLGTTGGVPVYAKDLPLKEYVFLYKKRKDLYDLQKRYFEQHTFKMLLNRLAQEQGLDEAEYLRTRVFASIPSITNKEVDAYIQENLDRYKKFTHDMEALRKTVRQGLLEERKDEKLEALKAELFEQEGVTFDVAPIKKPQFDISVEEDDARIGPKKADADPDVDIVAFLDLTCRYCATVFPTLLNIQNTYPENLRLVFKHFPLNTRGNALQLAHEAECAGQQGLFFEYVDKVYSSGKGGQCRSCLEEFENEHGIDSEAFEMCLEDNTLAETITNDVKYGRNLGITSVPTIFVNGFPIIGAVNQKELERVIKEELESH